MGHHEFDRDSMKNTTTSNFDQLQQHFLLNFQVGKKWKGRLAAKAKVPEAKPLDARQLAAVLDILRQPPR